MPKIALTVDQINSIDKMQLVHHEAVRERFIDVYNTIWKSGGESAYERESRYFDRILMDNERLRVNSTSFSIFTSFIDLAVCGLSVEPGARALCYLQGRNHVVGKNMRNGREENVYEGRCALVVSGYGELVLRIRSGQIRHADNPVLVYKEDSFRFSDNDGRKSVSYTCNLPHVSNHVIAAFMKITRNDGTVDYAVMFEEDWLRLQGFSENQNRKWDKDAGTYIKGKPNELYMSNEGKIDTGFLMAKVIKHAFKTYPKVRIGHGTQLQTQLDRPESEEQDFYCVDREMPARREDENPAFGGPANDMASGVTIEPGDDGAF